MLYFAFCIHNHQPVGNFPRVIEQSYENAYLPFLKILSRHPSIKLTLHTSGFLLDWLVRNKPEYMELLKSMVSAGQVEMMGGGFYEPVLAVIPEEDRLGQIRMMQGRIHELFDTAPKGIWLAERVWEPGLPSTLKKAGVEYLLVDDYHFLKSGVPKEELGGYYVTEDMGQTIKVLPGSEALRYMIPFQPIERLGEHLGGLRGFLKKGNAAIYGDDGEKFGSWPGTHKWVYDEGWLEAFFKKLESIDWLIPITLAGLVSAEDAVGRVYLPAASYMEMGEWALPAKAARSYAALLDELKGRHDGEKVKEFMQGGIWRNFFAKYPEANWMHKRMLRTSRALRDGSGRLDETRLKAAKDALYKAQCNDAYWHGVFGGLYLPHLRTGVYEHILASENILGSGHADDGATVTMEDLDADGRDEVSLDTGDLNACWSPHEGGALIELDYRPRTVNFLNTLSRWPEGYHHKLDTLEKQKKTAGVKTIHDLLFAKEEGLYKLLKTDIARRASFLDHFLPPSTTLDAFSSNAHVELGAFHVGKFECLVDDDGAGFSLSRWADMSGVSVFVSKKVRAPAKDTLAITYRVDNDVVNPSDEGPLKCLFGVELNVMLPCCDGPACLYQFAPPHSDRCDLGLGETGELKDVSALSLIDRLTSAKLGIEITGPMILWRFPVHTVSLSEAGFEKIYQGTCLLFSMPMDLRTHLSTEFEFRIKAEAL